MPVIHGTPETLICACGHNYWFHTELIDPDCNFDWDDCICQQSDDRGNCQYCACENFKRKE